MVSHCVGRIGLATYAGRDTVVCPRKWEWFDTARHARMQSALVPEVTMTFRVPLKFCCSAYLRFWTTVPFYAHQTYGDSDTMSSDGTAMDDNSDDDHPPEWATHMEYIRVLRSSADPLLQLLANIEDLDGTLCALGQRLEDVHTYSLEMIAALDDTPDSLAVAIVRLLDQTAHSCLPTVIGHMQTAHHVLAYARLSNYGRSWRTNDV